jgi:hypothetical protein
VNESTPEERLKKYKENLTKMALLEGRELKLTNPVKSQKSTSMSPLDTRPSRESGKREAVENIRPPQVLVSPSKRELRESIISSRKKGDEFKTSLDRKTGRNRVMLKAREKAIDGSLSEIKNKRSMLELQLKKKMISKDEYDRRMKLLVEEGQRLLREKAGIDKALAE